MNAGSVRNFWAVGRYGCQRTHVIRIAVTLAGRSAGNIVRFRPSIVEWTRSHHSSEQHPKDVSNPVIQANNILRMFSEDSDDSGISVLPKGNSCT